MGAEYAKTTSGIRSKKYAKYVSKIQSVFLCYFRQIFIRNHFERCLIELYKKDVTKYIANVIIKDFDLDFLLMTQINRKMRKVTRPLSQI